MKSRTRLILTTTISSILRQIPLAKVTLVVRQAGMPDCVVSNEPLPMIAASVIREQVDGGLVVEEDHF